MRCNAFVWLPGVLTTCALVAPVSAQTLSDAPALEEAGRPSDDAPWSFGVFWENDSRPTKWNNIQDRHYTNGVAVTAAHHPQWARRLAEVAPFSPDEPEQTAAGYVLGQLMFTPSNLRRETIIGDDRPYAGYLYGGVYWQRTWDDTLDHVQLDVGVIGDWSLADETQQLVHDVFEEIEPQGWEHQLENEPTVQVYARRKWRLDLNPIGFDDFRLDAQVIPQVGLALGTVYRHAEAGATFRVGYRLPDDFGAGRIGDLPAATGGLQRGWSAYGYVQALGQAVAYNHFLHGSNFQDEPHTVDAEPLVGELTLGLAAGYRVSRWSAAVKYSQTFLTDTFDTQERGDAYASLGIVVVGRF